MRSYLRGQFLVRVAGLALLIAAVASSRADQLEIVALSGDSPHTDVPATAFFRFDDPPVINNQGEVAFLAGPSVDQGGIVVGGTSVWAGRQRQLELIANQDQVALGGRTTFSSFSNVRLNNRSGVAFESVLAGPDIDNSNRDTLWLATTGLRHLVAKTGDTPPGMPGFEFTAFESMLGMSDEGDLAFFARTLNDDDLSQGGSGLWVGATSETIAAAVHGQSARTGESDEVFLRQSFEIPVR